MNLHHTQYACICTCIVLLNSGINSQINLHVHCTVHSQINPHYNYGIIGILHVSLLYLKLLVVLRAVLVEDLVLVGGGGGEGLVKLSL